MYNKLITIIILISNFVWTVDWQEVPIDTTIIETSAIETSNEIENNSRLYISDYCKLKILEVFTCLSISAFVGSMFYIIYIRMHPSPVWIRG